MNIDLHAELQPLVQQIVDLHGQVSSKFAARIIATLKGDIESAIADLRNLGGERFSDREQGDQP